MLGSSSYGMSLLSSLACFTKLGTTIIIINRKCSLFIHMARASLVEIPKDKLFIEVEKEENIHHFIV